MVRLCRHNARGTPWVPIWTDIKTVLELHGLWAPEIQQKLDLCFTALLVVEAEKRELDGPRTR